MEELNLTGLPAGVRFRPTAKELIQDYLSRKINGSDQGAIDFIRVVTFFKQDPGKLLDLTGIKTRDPDDHYFFFSEPDAKYRNGNRVNRKTDSGYWKLTGKDYEIWSEGRLIGTRKILVFHVGKSPDGAKTNWIVHEYHSTELDGNNPGQKAFVLCHLFWKSNNGSEGRKGNSSEAGPSKSKQAWASISPASGGEADNHVTGYCTDIPVAGGDNNVNSFAAENQETDIEVGLEMEEALNMYSGLLEDPLDCNCLNCLTPLPNTSDIPVAGGDNNVNYFAAENQVTEIEVGLEMEEALNMYSGLLEDPLDCNCLNCLTPLPNTSDIPVVGGDNNVNSFAAENQVTEIEVDLEMEEALNMYSGLLEDPLDCNCLNCLTPLPNTSDIPVAGGDNNVNSFAAENQVTDIEVDPEMEEAPNMYSGLLEDPLDCNSLNFLTPLPNTFDIPVAGGDNNVNSFAAENRETDIEVDLEMEEALNTDSFLLQDPLDCNCLNGLTPLPNTPAISSPPTAISSLEAESELAPASASPALGKEVSNHLTRCYSNGMTSNTITAINGNRDGYSAYTAINRVEEETTGEVVDSNMFCFLPDSNMFDVPPDLNVFCVPPVLLGLSPLHLQMQSVYMPYSVANDSNYLGDEVPFQYGTNVPAAFTSDLCGPPSLFR